MDWKRVGSPKKKSDYRYKFLRLLASPPPSKYDWLNRKQLPPLPVAAGDVVRISMRRAYGEIESVIGHGFEEVYGLRVLELEWKCPHCEHPHKLFIPESWIAEGKAEFVEAHDE